ncbi:hypothetical protein BB560_007276 [Smittium megazygosporum]|uniref:Phospho-2-dehydro-3-deoxyheptonate aldolase n=1 Tax=Smittium megazygosporum TaxID=133381 RepID=A0A2T9XXB5_9FUNG|nr:hypothetical protein BB560_007276 [Smittium megazygosporum]
MLKRELSPHPEPEWSPSSWRSKEIKHNVEYKDPAKLNSCLEKLRSLPPLVAEEEIDTLRRLLANASRGEAFVLQCGDCAETFSSCTPDSIQDRLKIILQMSLVLIWGLRTPIVRIARMCGQFAKPRSSETEVINGETVLTFRGEIINGISPSDRNTDPNRLVEAYFHSASVINYVRSLLSNNFADLKFPHNWDLDWVKDDQIRSEYKDIINRLADSFDFMQTIGAESQDTNTKSINLFTSHEALLLNYEEALTRKRAGKKPSKKSGSPLIKESLSFSSQTNLTKAKSSNEDKWYNTSAHFIWIGDRTRQLNGAHVEYFRGIQNPIGVKVGPSMHPDELVRILDILDPNFEPGRVTLISRYGANKIESHLPDHISAVRSTNHKVVWSCDPCHGNTTTTAEGIKTRSFDDIIKEIISSIEIHTRMNSKINGIHLELTGEHVTECVGGSQYLEPVDLSQNYQTFCDPRLNYLQSLDIAFKISNHYRK